MLNGPAAGGFFPEIRNSFARSRFSDCRLIATFPLGGNSGRPLPRLLQINGTGISAGVFRASLVDFDFADFEVESFAWRMAWKISLSLPR